MANFFAKSDVRDRAPLSTIPKCSRCRLRERCSSPLMPIDGEGKRRILIVGEAPGSEEDAEGQPFVGRSGEELEESLSSIGVRMRKDCWITNALICWPWGKSEDGRKYNRTPTEAEIGHCRPNVVNAIRKLKPERIVLLGAVAVKSVIGWLWKEDTAPYARWIGQRIPCRRIGAWIFPAWHPSYLIRQRKDGQETVDYKILAGLQRRYLKYAFRKELPPVDTEDLTTRVRVITDHVEAAVAIRKMTADTERPIAFDYETTTLKPDDRHARIVCASVSDGETAVAFPWYGDAVTAMKIFLSGPSPKWGYHDKFEDRWTRKEFGRGVRNWQWDGMLAAHALDNRPGTTGLKFQSFARLGVEPYDEHVGPFLAAKTGNAPNSIKDVGQRGLLTYCGLDSLLEHKIAAIQRRELGAE